METKLNLCIALSTLFFGKAFAEGVVINDAFSDVDFQNYVSQSFDKDKDGVLSAEECAGVYKISVKNVLQGATIDGLGNFPNLESLDCSGNYLDKVDFSKNPSFHYLCCNENSFGTLNLSSAPLLETLIFCGGSASTIDLRNNPNVTYVCLNFSSARNILFGSDSKLVDLECDNAIVNSLDVSGCSQLEMVDLDYCLNLTKLDLSHNPKLKKLYCVNNRLTTLNLSNNPELEILSCSNEMTEIGYLNKFTNLDLSHNPNLKKLYCNETQLESIDLSNNSLLEVLECKGNMLTSLNLSHCPELTSLSCSDNHLSSLYLNRSAMLKTLKCDNNSYDVESDGNGQIDVTTLPDSFDVTKVSNLEGATLEGNLLTVNPQSKIITYDYAAGWKKATFKLNVSPAEIDLTNVMDVEEFSYSIQNVDGAIVIENAENHYAEVFSVDGRMVFADYLTDVRQSISVADGCYLVKIGEVTTKVIVR